MLSCLVPVGLMKFLEVAMEMRFLRRRLKSFLPWTKYSVLADIRGLKKFRDTRHCGTRRGSWLFQRFHLGLRMDGRIAEAQRKSGMKRRNHSANSKAAAGNKARVVRQQQSWQRWGKRLCYMSKTTIEGT
jgi:hypothetical protein